MASKSPFTSLASELLIAIAETVEPRDLLALRLTCHTLSSAMVGVYLKTFFRVRRHFYTYESIRNLADISSSRLGKEITHIEIAVPDGVVKEKLRPVSCARFLFEVEELEDHGMPLLKKLFSNLAMVGATPSLQIRGWNEQDDKLMRRRNQHIKLAGRWCPIRADCDDAAALFLSAIAVTRFPVQSLDVCITHAFTYDTPSTSRLDDKVLFGGPHGPFAALTQLQLSFRYFPHERYEVATFQNVFGSAQNLRSISLAGTQDETTRRRSELARFASALPLDKIEHVTLCWMSVTASDLISFLESKTSTVKTLMLYGILLDEFNRWPTVFRWIASHLSLDHATFGRLHKRCDSTELKLSVSTFCHPATLPEELLKLADSAEV